MAFDNKTDYKKIIDDLTKSLATAQTAEQKAALQAQIDSAQASREEKIASDLGTYGKYATSGELDNIFTGQATKSIGSQYDQAAKQLGESYNAARQSANNDALSRGMARSSFVSDRLSSLDSKEADARSMLDENKATAIYNAATQLRNAYDTKQANALAQEKADFLNSIGAYSNDYMAQINKITNDGNPSNDWQIPFLQAARQQKISDQQSAQAAAQQQAFENQLAAAKVYNSGSSGGGGGGGYKATETAEPTYGGYTRDEIVKMVQNGMLSKEDGTAILSKPDGAGGVSAQPTANASPTATMSAQARQAYTLLNSPSADGTASQYTPAQKEQMLAIYLQRGAITEDEFIQLMQLSGLDPSKYMS